MFPSNFQDIPLPYINFFPLDGTDGNEYFNKEDKLFQHSPLFFNEPELIDNSLTEKKNTKKEDNSLNIENNEESNANTKLEKETIFTTYFIKNKSSNLKDDLKSKENNGIKSEIIPKNGSQNKQMIKVGRKRKEDKTIGIHTKNSEDNKMIKIKTIFGNNLHNFINSFLEKGEKLIKLEPTIHEKLKKDFNIRLWDTPLKTIYLTTNIISKKKKEKDKNKEIIKKIYENKDNKYYDIIQLLNLTYGEAFQIFIRNIKPMNLELTNKILNCEILMSSKFPESNDVFNQIILKERRKETEEFIDNYINGEKGIKELSINFINWFKNKKGRNRIKNV